MNRLLRSSLLLLLATTVHAQGPTEVKTGDGRIVILKPDGTWEYKKETPRPSPGADASPPGQSAGAGSLPPNFAGHDTRRLSTQLGDLKKRLVKSEFETTADYEKRAAQERQKPILGDLTIRDTFSLVVPGVEASYNADSQQMQFFLPVEKSPMAEALRRSRIGRDKRTAYTLEYANLYSIQWEGDGSYFRQGIFFDETGGLPLTEKGYRPGFSAEVQLGVEEARRLKNTTRAVIAVQFEEPYVGARETQFQVRLIDVRFFDPQTGRVLAKLGQGGK